MLEKDIVIEWLRNILGIIYLHKVIPPMPKKIMDIDLMKNSLVKDFEL